MSCCICWIWKTPICNTYQGNSTLRNLKIGSPFDHQDKTTTDSNYLLSNYQIFRCPFWFCIIFRVQIYRLFLKTQFTEIFRWNNVRSAKQLSWNDSNYYLIIHQWFRVTLFYEIWRTQTCILCLKKIINLQSSNKNTLQSAEQSKK